MGRPIRVGDGHRSRTGGARAAATRTARTRRGVAAALLATALTLTAGGCVTVHGEREVVPTATADEAAAALTAFITAYNAGDKEFDPALSAPRVTGALGAINQAGLKSLGTSFPGGNPRHVPLELTDARYSIPRKAGWPRWFVADADSNQDRDGGGPADSRWMLVFLREAPDTQWRVSYLTVVPAGRTPRLKTDAEGHAVPVDVRAEGLAAPPARLGQAYSSYLKDGSGRVRIFADGPHTSQWRAQRLASANRPGLATQWVDQPADGGAFAPLALATSDGGALVFFALRSFERQTAAKGVPIPVVRDLRPLLEGEPRTSLTKERISVQLALVPRASGSGLGGAKVEILARLAGMVTARGR
jgi:hypothetical protein